MLNKLLNRMQTEQGRKNIKFALARKIFNPLLRNIGYTLITDHFYSADTQPSGNYDIRGQRKAS